jgi:pimeloyl-ACP methyl ester carboxylesterase
VSDQSGGGAKPGIVLIHGLWLTPLCWEFWVQHYRERGYQVKAPSWPGMEFSIDELRADPSILNGLGILEVVGHYVKVIRRMPSPPILIGHSFGGLVVQMLLDRGYGSAGVALHSAPAKGVWKLPWSALRASFPVLRNPVNRLRTVPLTPKQFHYAFTNTMDAGPALAAYNRYHIPAPGRPLLQAALANITSGAATTVRFNNNDRAPLLFIAGDADHNVPPAMNRSNYNRYQGSTAVTDFKEYPGRGHFTVGESGWEDVANYALDWATNPPNTEALLIGRPL